MLTLICLASSLAHAAAPPVNHPIPKNARHLFVANGWRVVDVSHIVPGTERNRAPLFHHRFYAGKIGSNRGRIVFNGSDTGGGPRVLTVRADGSVLLDVYPSRLVWVAPGGPVAHFGDGKPVRLPGVKGDLRLLHANAFGVVAIVPEWNAQVPVYFIPLAGRSPVPARAVKLVERESNSVYATRTGFHVCGRWVVWGGREIGLPYTRPLRGPVGALDCKTMKRWGLPVPRDTAILGVEGDLVVVRHGKEPAGEVVGQVDTFDLATRKRLTSYETKGDVRLLAIRDGIGYFATPLPDVVGKKANRRRVEALDLLKKRKPLASREAPPPPSLRAFHAVPTGKGLQLLTDPPAFVEWATRP